MLFLCISTVFSGMPKKAEAAGDPLGIQAEATILLDVNTGKILYQKNIDTVLGVASMTKMMTEYIVLESIKNKKITWNQKVKINHYVHQMSDESTGLSNVGLTEGEEYTVDELYKAMAIHSGNGAAVALAELVSGSEKNFVNLMNKKAAELGLKDYKFVNASGLNNTDLLGKYPAGSATDENLMSARATAKLAYHLITDFPEALEISKIANLKFRDKKLPYKNFNWMLPSLIHGYEGVDGLKTGHTDLAGYCFTATAERNGQRYITVVMKAKTQDSRFTETRKILDYAFGNFTNEEIVKKHYQDKGHKSLSVIKGKEDKVKIYSKDAINMVVKSGEKANYQPVLVLDKKKLNKNGELTAPIKKGEKVGYLTLKPKNGANMNFLYEDGNKKVTVDVVAENSVEKANWFVLMMRGIGGFFGDLFGGISSTVKGWF
ncbi:D-alanyl-D-alanine carboxypeptidase family protein [Cytobacillus sp. Hz8]|uniref:D-alanyl-D-alanine carboxypeptidase family protein n=1 Tax=Cytobacillus sp. Hz8 TaxID=3347168 RepID=UPI0035D8D7BB